MADSWGRSIGVLDVGHVGLLSTHTLGRFALWGDLVISVFRDIEKLACSFGPV